MADNSNSSSRGSSRSGSGGSRSGGGTRSSGGPRKDGLRKGGPRKDGGYKGSGPKGAGSKGGGGYKGSGAKGRGSKDGGSNGGGYKGARSDRSGPNKGPNRGPRRDNDRRPPRAKLSPAQTAREAAMIAVGDVLGRGFRLEGALARNEDLQRIDARDRAFARAIAATTLRRLGQIDGVLAPLVKRPPPGRVQAAMQTAAAQMIFMDVAPHAAVGDTVAILKADHKAEPFSGLVNAVLRKVADIGKAEAARIPPIKNVPGWLRSDWTKSYGKSEMRRLALLLTQSPTLDLSVKSDPEGWAKRLGGRVMGGETVRMDEIGNVSKMDGFADGAWWAQDMAASLPARMLETASGGLSGKRVADLCAAPGGKTQQFCRMGADVTAVDLSEARTDRLRQNLARTHYNAEIITKDILEYTPEQAFDAVLLDAPCSATGTFRRHPDVIYNRSPKDITLLTRLQDRLLAHAAEWVVEGGVMVYSVCSLQDREGTERVLKFLKARPDFRLIPLSQPAGLSLPEDRLAGGTLRLLPTDAADGRGMDGFFIAALQRNAAAQ